MVAYTVVEEYKTYDSVIIGNELYGEPITSQYRYLFKDRHNAENYLEQLQFTYPSAHCYITDSEIDSFDEPQWMDTMVS